MPLRRLAFILITLNIILVVTALALGSTVKGLVIAYTTAIDDLTVKIDIGDLSRGLSRRLNTTEYNNYLPVWSPDGQQIAFYAFVPPAQNLAEGQRALYVMDWNGDWNGKNLRLIASEPAYENFLSGERPAWSPDGKQIAFISTSGNIGSVYVIHADGSGLRHVSDHSSSSSLIWSPDGQYLVFGAYDMGEWHLFGTRLDGEVQKLTTQFTKLNYMPAFSPDGQKIVFASSRDKYYSELYIMEGDDSQLQRLTDNENQDISPGWSPDGSRIAYVSIGKDGQSTLRIMTADGKQEIDLGLANYLVRWSPDGEWVGFPFADQIYAKRVDGSVTHHTTDKWGAFLGTEWFDWRP